MDDLVLVPARAGEKPGTWQQSGRRELKRDRQVRRLTEIIVVGDRVVVPDDEGWLRVGVVTAGYRYDDRRGAHARPIR